MICSILSYRIFPFFQIEQFLKKVRLLKYFARFILYFFKSLILDRPEKNVVWDMVIWKSKLGFLKRIALKRKNAENGKITLYHRNFKNFIIWTNTFLGTKMWIWIFNRYPHFVNFVLNNTNKMMMHDSFIFLIFDSCYQIACTKMVMLLY